MLRKSSFALLVTLSASTLGCPIRIPPIPYILTVVPVDCACDSECLFDVKGTIARVLDENEELFLVVRPVDDLAPRYFLQFGEKIVNHTIWSAQAQAGSSGFPPHAGDVVEIYAIVVDSALMGSPSLEPLTSLSTQDIPWLLTVSDVQRISVECDNDDGTVLDALENHTYWHLYSPARNEAGEAVREEQVRRELQMLYDSGARGLVTYEMMKGIQRAPCIAKEIGFQWVLAGIYWYTDGVDNGQTNSTLEEEKSAIHENSSYIDGIIIGNEGLLNSDEWNQPRYTLADLERELRAMKEEYPNQVVTTAEGKDTYERYAHLVSDGELTDFVFPNLHAYWGIGGSPEGNPLAVDAGDGVNWLRATLSAEPFSSRGDRLLVMHETWWPAEKAQDLEEDAQVAFFQGIVDAGIRFCWGETVDQPWKSDPEGPIGAHWGLWHYDAPSDTYEPKSVVNLFSADSH